jgi:O-antigen/teichoic acid export membrane protein
MAGKTIKIFFTDLKSYFNSGKYIFLFNLLERFTFFAFYISIARYVDKEIYGFIVTVFTFTNIIATIFDFGIPIYLHRESATGRAGINFLFHGVVIKILFSIILLPIPFIYFINDHYYFEIILLVTLINYFSPINQILIFYLNGKYKFKENFLSILISRVPYFIFLLVATINKIDVKLSLISIFTSLIFQNVLLFKFSLIRIADLINLKFKFGYLFDLIRNSAAFGLSVLFVMIYDRLGTLFLQQYFGYEAVAIYSAAYALYKHTSIVFGIILVRSYNIFSINFARDGKILYKDVFLTIKLLFILLVSLISLFTIGGDFIINAFYSSRFKDSVSILKIFAIGLPFLFLSNLTGTLLNSTRNERYTALSTFFGLIVNIITNIIFIPKFGIIGAVSSNIITEAFVLLFEFLFIKKLIRFE